MNLFELTAYADGGAGNGGASGMIATMFPFVLIIVIMYFMMIRPQKKKEKLKQEMLSQLIKGDKILTIGGIHGKIVSIKDDDIILETGGSSAEQKSFVKICRWAVGEVTKPADEPKSKNDTESSEDAE